MLTAPATAGLKPEGLVTPDDPSASVWLKLGAAPGFCARRPRRPPMNSSTAGAPSLPAVWPSVTTPQSGRCATP
jgi:hypothetical protein